MRLFGIFFSILSVSNGYFIYFTLVLGLRNISYLIDLITVMYIFYHKYVRKHYKMKMSVGGGGE